MCYTFNLVLLLAVAAAATTHTPRNFCTAPWNACLTAEPTREGPATAFCSSYLSIGTVTSTVTPAPSVTDITTTTTVYESTTTVIDPAVYASCPPTSTGNDKVRRGTATHTLPTCLRRFGTTTSAISHACSCLGLTSSTTYTTLPPSSVTSTITATTTASVSTALQDFFYMSVAAIDDSFSGDYYLERVNADYPIVLVPPAGGTRYQLAGSSGAPPCALYTHVGEQLFTIPNSQNLVFFNGSDTETPSDYPVICSLDSSTNELACASNGLDMNINNGGAWQLADAPGGSGEFNIIAMAYPGQS